MNANDNAIWQAMGIGQQWHLKAEPAAPTAISSAILLVGDFDLSEAPSSVGPEGQAGVLLLNMLSAIAMPIEKLRFLSLRQFEMQSLDLKNHLKQNPFAQVILIGDTAARAVFGGQSSAANLHGRVQQFELPGCNSEVLVMPALAELIAQPALKEKAWESLCLIRARFLLPH